ncbi:GNAT family N-acetyltransferase [Micromonospora sp. CPCC 205556]|uniref:GNAT family N-acetyltransferase n=1 Tax=Micromonospora sp. CPCC 205556 TaxID=3122398 RepID=UPI002FEF95D7
MTETMPPLVDLAATLRALRRAADLSQRELAERSGVPQATLARIESGAREPRFGTVERLVRAVGGRIVISVAPPGVGLVAVPPVSGPLDEDDGTGSGEAEATCSLPAVPHDELRDRAGRRYPAHLDVWPVREPRDWPGAWWADWYNLPPERHPLRLPPATYERDRGYRDRRRRAEQVRREFRVRWVTDDGRPDTAWRFVAELPGGELIGELRAHERSPHLLYGFDEERWPRELVLDGVLVDGEHRRLGVGRRLVEALLGRMEQVDVARVAAVADGGGVAFLAACGFRGEARRTVALALDRPVSAASGRPRSGR